MIDIFFNFIAPCISLDKHTHTHMYTWETVIYEDYTKNIVILL